MKLPLYVISLALVFVCLLSASAQKRRSATTSPKSAAGLMVIDETLSVLRTRPSLFAEPIQRMRRGRKVQVLGTADADGVRFYRVVSAAGHAGWVQADALFGRSRNADEERLARLIAATDGFDQIELADAFLEMYPTSRFRAPILLLFGAMFHWLWRVRRRRTLPVLVREDSMPLATRAK